MSSKQSTTAVQAEIHVPSLNDVNPITNEPLLQTLAKGEMPSNAIINDAIDRTQNLLTDSLIESNLSTKGTQLVQDTSDLLESAQNLINNRNKGDKIQHLLEDSKVVAELISKEASEQASKLGSAISNAKDSLPSASSATSMLPSWASFGFNFPTKQVEKGVKKGVKEAKTDVSKAYNYGRELVLYSIRSGEFRKFLLEWIDFVQSTFIDDAAGSIAELKKSIVEDLKNKDVQMSETSESVKEAVGVAKEKLDYLKNVEWDEDMVSEYWDRFSNLLSQIADKNEYAQLLEIFWKWMDEVKSKASDINETLVEKLPELKEQVEAKASKLAEAVQEKGQEAKKTAKKVVKKAKKSAKELKLSKEASEAYDKVWDDVKDIVDSFSSEGSFNTFFSKMWNLYFSLLSSEESSGYFFNLKNFITDAIANPMNLQSTETIQIGKELLVRGRELIRSSEWKDVFGDSFSNFKDTLSKIANDTVSNDFTAKLNKFAKHFACNADGKLDLFQLQESLAQVKNIVFPILSKRLQNITIDKIVESSDSMDWSVENLVLCLPEFLPESFSLKTKNDLDFNLSSSERNTSTKVILDLKGLKPSFQNVAFWYKRKSFPAIDDKGHVNIDVSQGEGARIKVVWKIKSRADRPFTFSLMEVKCIIDELDIDFIDAKHELIDRIGVAVFSESIKQAVAEEVVRNIVSALDPINQHMNQWFATKPLDTLKHKVQEEINSVGQMGNNFIQNQPVEKALDLAKSVKDSVAQTLDSAKTAIADKASEIQKVAVDSYNSAAETVSNATDQVTSFASDAVDATSEFVNDAMETASEKASDLKDSAAKVAKTTGKKVGKGVSKATESVKDMMDTSEIQETASALKDELMDKAKESGASLLKQAKKRAADVMDASDEISETASQVKKRATKLKEKAVEKASEKVYELRDRAIEVATDKASELKDKVVEAAKDKALGVVGDKIKKGWTHAWESKESNKQEEGEEEEEEEEEEKSTPSKKSSKSKSTPKKTTKSPAKSPAASKSASKKRTRETEKKETSPNKHTRVTRSVNAK